VAAAVTVLKQRPGRELQVHGSHGLIQTLLGAGLVDAFNVWTFPVAVGKGKRLFGEGTVATSMRRMSTDLTTAGVVVTSYEPTGPLEQQTFVVEEGKEAIQA
jgi:dihydrofolate reductase